VRRALQPGRYTKEPHRFETMRANVNLALAFSGLAVDATGKLFTTTTAKTLDEAARRADELRVTLSVRGVHADVLRFCRAELIADNYFHAVLEAAKSIFDKVRTKTGFTEDGGPALYVEAIVGVDNTPSQRVRASTPFTHRQCSEAVTCLERAPAWRSAKSPCRSVRMERWGHGDPGQSRRSVFHR